MTKELVPYQEALELKELGFDEKGFMRIWWLNSVHYQTKVPFEPHITMNGQDIKFEYPIPEKHPSSGFGALELQVPTFSQAFRFFRESYKLHHSIDYECSQHDHKWGYNWSIYNYNQVVKTDEEYITSHPDAPAGEWVYDSDGEAELACLRKLIEIVKQNKTAAQQ